MWLINSCQLHLSGVRCYVFHHFPNSWARIPVSPTGWIGGNQNIFQRVSFRFLGFFSFFLFISVISALIFLISCIGFKLFLPCPTLSLWNSNYMNIRLLDIILQIIEALFIYSPNIFPLCVSFCMIYIAGSSSSLLLFSTVSNLHLVPSKVFFISDIVFSSVEVPFGFFILSIFLTLC